jgi:hypothetical protein
VRSLWRAYFEEWHAADREGHPQETEGESHGWKVVRPAPAGQYSRMTKTALLRSGAALVAGALLPLAAAQAQRARPAAPTAAPPAAPAYDPTLYVSGTATAPLFKSLRWRNVGPDRGGRVDAVVGDLAKPFLFYMGSVNGGVWRTTTGGQTWQNITDGKTDISSVGAITVAPSDPNVIYVGTGESQLREDLTFGTGMYRSTDAGQSWQHLGLVDDAADHRHHRRPARPRPRLRLRHRPRLRPQRGSAASSARSTADGRGSRSSSSTTRPARTDLAIDPANPRILYASFYKFQRTPWSMLAGGGRSGLWKTTDGGETWTEISRNPGIPRTPLGKIGIDVSRANPRRLYASIEAPDSTGGFFRSDDAGATWERMNDDPRIWVRNWYYSTVTADPKDENTVYVMNLSVLKSIDGGRRRSPRSTSPHGDTHILWVDPNDPRRMILGNDGGATVSFDGGKSPGRASTTSPPRSSITSTPTTSSPTASTAPSRTTRRSPSPRAATTARSASATTSPSPAARTPRSPSTRATRTSPTAGATSASSPATTIGRGRSATSPSPRSTGTATPRRTCANASSGPSPCSSRSTIRARST